MHNLAVIRIHGVLNLSILTQPGRRNNPGVSRHFHNNFAVVAAAIHRQRILADGQ